MAEIYENGSQRSEKRLRYDLIPFYAMRGYAERATMGTKYGDNNYRKGGDEFFKDAKNHLIHHMWCYLEGRLEDEQTPLDHLKAVLWNAGSLVWYEETKLEEDKASKEGRS